MQNSGISASLEDYLEALYHIIRKKQAAKAKDLVNYLKVTAASVTGALRILSKKGLINYAPYDVITLTDEGAKVAKDVVRRHEVLKDFMTIVLGISEKEADEAACKMEHSISSNVLEKLRIFIEFLEVCPRSSNQWISKYRNQCYAKNDIDLCLGCTESLVDDLKSIKLQKTTEYAESISLNELPVNMKARVIRIDAQSGAKKRLAELGIIKNSILELDKLSVLDKVLHVSVRGYHLTLRMDEAEAIFVQPVGLLDRRE